MTNTTSTRTHLVSFRTDETREALVKLRQATETLLPQFGDESWNKHCLLTMNVTVLSRLLYLNDLYQKIISVPGVICEFGVQWGATLTQLINLRSIYEPFNHSRTIHGFDTFEGFPSVHEIDGPGYREGDMSSQQNHEIELEKILTLIEKFPPMSHLKKFEIIKGDVNVTVENWLNENPHAIVSLAIFDMDLYVPTKRVLELIRPRLTKGSVLAFDELNCKAFPGETHALDEVFGLNNLKIRRSPFHPFGAWAVYGE
ncbi:crotonobetainyl-CoA--carnitine CoA-transferase [bacterium SGD-2]|nr:crotonobetainyl-CoA--carnitine CoA-transferase [bacterium SGD-2]